MGVASCLMEAICRRITLLARGQGQLDRIFHPLSWAHLVVFGVRVGDVDGIDEVATVRRLVFLCALARKVKIPHARGTEVTSYRE